MFFLFLALHLGISSDSRPQGRYASKSTRASGVLTAFSTHNRAIFPSFLKSGENRNKKANNLGNCFENRAAAPRPKKFFYSLFSDYFFVELLAAGAQKRV
ncbi:MAG: hypothetical protein J6T16_07550 [Opitutales bacterium]|nr:hypothetical protein [Opitutales bacterium]